MKEEILVPLVVLGIFIVFVFSVSFSISGQIVIKTSFCNDTDKTKQFPDGRNYFIPGTVSGEDAYENEFKHSDVCYGNYLKEYWCDKNSMRFEYKNILRSEIHFCPNGCVKGICRKKLV